MSEVENLVVEMSHYGYPLARFDEVVLSVWGRDVYVDAIYWDAEYGCYFGSGHYARKDGSRGRRVAKPVMSAVSMPEAVLSALQALK